MIAILRLLHTDDATVAVAAQPTDVDEQSLAAAEQLRKRRPNLNFEEMGIPIGAQLRFSDTGVTATVISAKKVRLGDEDVSLTAATRQLLQLDYNVQPGPHWIYNGRTIHEIYEETYSEPE